MVYFITINFQGFRGGPGGPTFPWGSQMLIYIETHRFSRGGGGSFYCVCKHQSFGRNIASVAN